jgi:hypothetical protein
MQARLPKTKRDPEAFANARITDRSLAVIEAIARHRFILARDVVRVVGGNDDVTHRHLQHLFHRDLISRLSLPVGSHRGEFVYFLDNAEGLRRLYNGSKLNADSLDWDEITRSRQKYGVGKMRSAGQLLFIEHELMISRFHADLESAARDDGNLQLERWVQGAAIWNSVQIDPKRQLPHRPDALFTLKFLTAPEGQQRATFLYEADRETSSILRIKEKFHAHAAFLLQGLHSARYSIRRIRAVLVETLSPERAVQIREMTSQLAKQVPIAGRMFWFSSIGSNGRNLVDAQKWTCAADDLLRSLRD